MPQALDCWDDSQLLGLALLVGAMGCYGLLPIKSSSLKAADEEPQQSRACGASKSKINIRHSSIVNPFLSRSDLVIRIE